MSKKILLVLLLLPLFLFANTTKFDADIKGNNLVITENQSSKITIPLSKELKAIIANRQDSYTFEPVSFAEKGDLKYFVCSITVPTVKAGTKGQCSSGKEAYIIWNEIDPDNNIIQSVAVLYTSCIFSIKTNLDSRQVTKDNIRSQQLMLPIIETLPTEKISYLVFKEDEPEKGFNFIEL